MPPTPTARPSGAGEQATRKFTIADVTGKGQKLPTRFGLYSVEGWGKTSWASHFPNPLFLQMKGEDGLDTLIANNQLPETPHTPVIESWQELKHVLQVLAVSEHDYKTLVIDTLNQAEKLCFEYVCENNYQSDMEKFLAYGKGPDVAVSEFKTLVNLFSNLRKEKNMGIVVLAHANPKQFRNPGGANYDVWAPRLYSGTWNVFSEWLDCILFGNYDVSVDTQKGGAAESLKRGKVRDHQDRVLYTTRGPSYEAKNRLGLAPEIYMGTSHGEGWANFTQALKDGRNVAKEEVSSGS